MLKLFAVMDDPSDSKSWMEPKPWKVICEMLADCVEDPVKSADDWDRTPIPDSLPYVTQMLELCKTAQQQMNDAVGN